MMGEGGPRLKASSSWSLCRGRGDAWTPVPTPPPKNKDKVEFKIYSNFANKKTHPNFKFLWIKKM
jgi:hypothetical protein